MTQQVNLFQPMFRREKRLLTARTMCQCLLVALLGLAGIYGFGAWQVQALDREVAGLETQRDTAVERLSRLQDKLPRRQQSQRLLDEIARVTRSLDERELLIETLSERINSPQGGLSQFMSSLARQRVEGLWLTGLQVAEGGQDIVIRGRALRPELIPVLVRRLSAEASFSGVKFRELNIDRRTPEDDEIEFELRTSAPRDNS